MRATVVPRHKIKCVSDSRDRLVGALRLRIRKLHSAWPQPATSGARIQHQSAWTHQCVIVIMHAHATPAIHHMPEQEACAGGIEGKQQARRQSRSVLVRNHQLSCINDAPDEAGPSDEDSFTT
jgi:hypothetical protein